jgi:hypothetical protein
MQLGGTAPVANSLQGKALGLDRSPPRQPSTAVMRRFRQQIGQRLPIRQGSHHLAGQHGGAIRRA